MESVSRLLDPVAIRYGEAMLVAASGLIVNYRALVDQVPGIVYLSVEVNHCRGETCSRQAVTAGR